VVVKRGYRTQKCDIPPQSPIESMEGGGRGGGSYKAEGRRRAEDQDKDVRLRMRKSSNVVKAVSQTVMGTTGQTRGSAKSGDTQES